MELEAEAEIGSEEVVVRCAVANLGSQVIYLLHLDFAHGTPATTIQYVPAPEGEASAQGWARLYAGGLEPIPGVVPCFPARNAGEPIIPNTALAVAFRLAHPVPEPEVAVDPDFPSLDVGVERLLVRLQYAPQPASSPPPAPARGFDLHGTETRIVETWISLDRPLIIRRAAGRGAGGGRR